MNLLDSSFLCLDIGTFAVRGVGIRIVSGRIAKSAAAAFESDDTEFAIKNVIDGLERDVGVHFDTAYVTGNFGNMRFDVITARKDFCTEHKITESDIMMMVFENMSRDDDFRPMHVVPLRYDLSGFQNIATPVGQIDRTVAAVFAVISYNDEGTLRVRAVLRAAHMTADDLSDTLFLVANTARPKNESALLIDMGASHTSIGIWTRRGPVFMARIPMGQETLTDAVQSTFNLPRAVAERIKRDNLSMNATAVDGFTPASTKYDFTRAEVNDVALPALDEILDAIVSAATPAVEKYHPEKIYLFGGGAAITGIGEVFAKKLGIPVQNLGASAAVDSVAANAWKRIAPRAKKYAARRKAQSDAVFKILSWFARPFKRKNKKRFIPIMPSTLAFNMRDMATYARFKSVNISMIHVDIMDGFYVDSVAGGIDDLKFIRSATTAHLHVHLMTENPMSWVDSVIDAGADTIILSTGTYGVVDAIGQIKKRGKRAGIALRPNASMEILRPILRDVDEILVMSVVPGAGGQGFLSESVPRISALDATRKKYNLKFKISVDGGINPETAQVCWRAGADYLVSGNYLAKSNDFPVAVYSLLKQ